MAQLKWTGARGFLYADTGGDGRYRIKDDPISLWLNEAYIGNFKTVDEAKQRAEEGYESMLRMRAEDEKIDREVGYVKP